jgi:type IV pilus assembly protein PilB
MTNDNVSVKILKILAEQHLLAQEKYQEFYDLATSDTIAFERAIIKECHLDAEQVAKIKAEVLGIDYVNFEDRQINSDLLKYLQQDVATTYSVAVFDQVGNDLAIGMVDPTNYKAIQAIEYICQKNNLQPRIHLISADSFRVFLKNYDNIKEQVTKVLGVAEKKFAKQQKDQADEEDQSLAAAVKSAPVSKMVQVIIAHAIDGGASDIHIEPQQDKSVVRYRIDGVLQVSLSLPLYIHASIISRIKVLANLKIDETRTPQDGRIRINHKGKDIDFRVSVLPLINNEKVVLRILEAPDRAPTLDELGFMGQHAMAISRNISKPNGMFLVTGPTGSGKSTTLFAVLNILNKEDVNICTLEDPVEYSVEGVNQSQVKPEVGYTFATGLRSLLRQDPDVIMVGEIRDSETAHLAINAALTGHFVLSTLHTNDARGAIPRLIDMGCEVFLLANTLNLIMAQRLVRKICSYCRQPDSLSEQLVKNINDDLATIPKSQLYKGIDLSNIKLYKGAGCAKCGRTGYKGRIAIGEVIEVNKEMREIIAKGFDANAADEALIHQGFISLLQDGWMKVLLGLTTVEEILRVTKSDD